VPVFFAALTLEQFVFSFGAVETMANWVEDKEDWGDERRSAETLVVAA
jgi:hypothetical protein